ncbi:MAG: superoxide dismutase [Chloroflexi bacterium HGW-Chloroflexi-2]|jgi:Fe-Mn family superoxide dismutase|nr:MAG: superoxide dismutase [Chloroflexi bacterium HGW-Chloroflexi-2]
MSQKFVLPELGYAYNALEAAIDAQTMEIHHSKHHAAYVNNLNAALENAPKFFMDSIEDVLRNINDVPQEIRQAVINNGGGHANHSLFWKILTPGGSNTPVGDVSREINSLFGSFENFVDAFSKAGATRFGSGWAWLVINEQKKLEVYSTANQDSPLSKGHTPLLTLDVWEHAYYLRYQNRRPDYIKAFWSVVNWDKVNQFYQENK